MTKFIHVYDNIAKINFRHFNNSFLEQFNKNIDSIETQPVKMTLEKLKVIEKILLKNPQIIKINLKNCKIKSDILTETLRIVKNSQELNLSQNLINAGDSGQIAQFIEESNLKSLNLYNNNLADIGAQEISKILSKEKNLQQLNIKNNGFSESGTNKIANAFLANHSLISIHFWPARNNEIISGTLNASPNIIFYNGRKTDNYEIMKKLAYKYRNGEAQIEKDLKQIEKFSNTINYFLGSN